MIGRDGVFPGAGALLQLAQEPRGILRVGARIEALVERGEGGGVVDQIDLEAANVDRTDAARLVLADGADGLGLAAEMLAAARGVDRPRPAAALRIRPTALNLADRRQQSGRQAPAALGFHPRLEAGDRHQFSPRRGRRGEAGHHQRRSGKAAGRLAGSGTMAPKRHEYIPRARTRDASAVTGIM